MFSGIVQACAEVVDLEKKKDFVNFTLNFPKNLSKNLKKGSSISVDGVCLTAVKVSGNKISFDVMMETLRKTTLKSLEAGKKVNIEKSIKVGDEIGGHPISGHVDCTAEIIKVQIPENNKILTFRCDKNWMKYIFPKGFISLDGVSLTVVDVFKNKGEFTVYLIPETLRITTFGFKKEGDFVNLEIDRQTQAIVDTVENILESRKRI